MPKVVLSPGAERALYRLPRVDFETFQRAFDAMELQPDDPGPSYRVKRMRGSTGNRVIRFGTWGAIFRIEGTRILILKVGPRSTLYRAR